jgi:hypothetical protein
MKLDEGIGAVNPYPSVAMIYAVFSGFLESCAGNPEDAGTKIPYGSMAKNDRHSGRWIPDLDPTRNDYSVLCLDCSTSGELSDSSRKLESGVGPGTNGPAAIGRTKKGYSPTTRQRSQYRDPG